MVKALYLSRLCSKLLVRAVEQQVAQCPSSVFSYVSLFS